MVNRCPAGPGNIRFQPKQNFTEIDKIISGIKYFNLGDAYFS